MDAFYAQLNAAKRKPAILKIVEPYSEQFIPKLTTSIFPTLLTELYSPESLCMDYLPLLHLCEEKFKSIKVCSYVFVTYWGLLFNNRYRLLKL